MLRELDRRITAYHEAGHVVVGHLMGFCVNDVYNEGITETGKRIGGVTIFASNEYGWCSASEYFSDCVLIHEKQAKICVAGRIAEQLFFPNDWSLYRSRSDWEGLKRELEYCLIETSTIINSTRKLLCKKENKQLVRRVAWVLYHRGHIDYLEMPVILGSKKRRWRIKRKLKQFFSKIKKRVEQLVKK